MKGVKVLVYGTGGRDHCLADEYAESSHVGKVYFAPGNPGVKYTRKGQRGIIEVVPVRDFVDVANFSRDNGVALVDVGSETPLDEGIVDVLNAYGIPTIGPRKEYARLENDRTFTDELLTLAGVPKPEYRGFTDPKAAKDYVRNIGYQAVIKPNGLAAGKGVQVCEDVDDALDAINMIMEKRVFGKAGDSVVVEGRKYGDEISFFAYLDGRHALPLRMFARDYKQACDPDDKEMIALLGRNPNTGGRGSYCPHKLVSPWLVNRIIKEVVNPTVDAIYNKLGWNYKGVLYFGLNLDPYNNLDVFEINVRHGDPEAEVLLRKLQTDLFEIGMATWNGTLDQVRQKWNDNFYVDVVAMTGRSRDEKGGWYPGYPARYGNGYKITGLEHLQERTLDPGVAVFFAGVDEHPDRGLVTKGGRVLHVVASDPDLAVAAEKARRNIEKFAFLDHKNGYANCMRYSKVIGL